MRLLLIIGPPAVGKMTVGREIAARSDFRLFHNHHTIEPLVEIFGYGTAPFTVLNSEFRRRVFEEAARHELDLIFTLVWNLADPADATYVEELVAPFEAAGGEIRVLELTADLDTRLVRNRGESRLAAKATKRDTAWSDANVRSMESLMLNSDPTGSAATPADGFFARNPHLRLDTRELTAAAAAEIALDWLDQQPAAVDSNDPWPELAADYERARSREDSLDRLVEWPAQRELLGDVTGLSVLDLGCGNGGKLAELVAAGAGPAVGVDVSGNFLDPTPPGLELIHGDLNDLESMPGLAGRRFDRILFLQSFGYAKDPVSTLRVARTMLADDGFILLTRTHPIRYAVERAEQNGTSLGEEYFARGSYTYRSGWNEQIALTQRSYTMSDLINVFSAAGLWIESAIEPQLSEADRRRFPHKQEWMNKHLGILIFKLRHR